MYRVVILGAPLSGKGTISQRIIKIFNIKHISSGDKLRQHIQEETAIGLKAQQFIKNGELVPDELMIEFIMYELEKVENESWILDGFPRTLSQAKALWVIEKLDLVINLIVPLPLEVISDRGKGRWVHLPSGRVYNEGVNPPRIPEVDDVTGEPLIQREDDKPEVILKRLQQYETTSEPVIKFYREKGILKEFCGVEVDIIWPLVLDYLSNHTPVHRQLKNIEASS